MIRIKYLRLFKHPLDQYQNYTIGVEFDVDHPNMPLEDGFEAAREAVLHEAAITEQDMLEQFDNGRTNTQHFKEKYGHDPKQPNRTSK